MLDLSKIDKEWTLFLDRDGVINDDKSPYTLNADQFEFYPGVPTAICSLGEFFRHIIVVTNQRGVGRNMMTEDDLLRIHDKLVQGVQDAGGRITRIYYCTATDNSHPDRKPNPGMALKAFEEFKDITPAKSIMVGNNISDMEFGRSAGMHTVLVHTTGTKVDDSNPLVDLQFNSLNEFTDALQSAIR
jgi:D-glycero-D-manno-heptose 1,7-bisphosphate phosphatase